MAIGAVKNENFNNLTEDNKTFDAKPLNKAFFLRSSAPSSPSG
jgi:hypothetical protein